MHLPGRFWFRMNRLRTGFGRLCSAPHNCGKGALLHYNCNAETKKNKKNIGLLRYTTEIWFDFWKKYGTVLRTVFFRAVCYGNRNYFFRTYLP